MVRQICYSSCIFYLSRMDICRHYCKYGRMAREYQLECLEYFSCHLDYHDDCGSDTPRYNDAHQTPWYIFQSRHPLGSLWYHVKETLCRPSSIWEYSYNNTSMYGVYSWGDYDESFNEKIILILFQFIFPATCFHITKYSRWFSRIKRDISVNVRGFIAWIKNINQKYNNIKSFKKNPIVS